jgi:hypothetical protein
MVGTSATGGAEQPIDAVWLGFPPGNLIQYHHEPHWNFRGNFLAKYGLTWDSMGICPPTRVVDRSRAKKSCEMSKLG